jgi:hypothetical protein
MVLEVSPLPTVLFPSDPSSLSGSPKHLLLVNVTSINILVNRIAGRLEGITGRYSGKGSFKEVENGLVHGTSFCSLSIITHTFPESFQKIKF